MTTSTVLAMARKFGCALTLLVTAASTHAGPVLRVAPQNAAVELGASIFVDIWADDVQDLYAFNFSLSFDPALIGMQSIAEGGFLQSSGSTLFVPGIDDGAGLISFTGSSLVGAVPGASGSGILATFSFVGNGLGTTGLALSDALFLDSQFADIPVGLIDSQLQVVPTTNIPEPDTLLLACSSLLAAAWALSLGRRELQRRS